MEKLNEKKEYPSQLNTKSMACRVPITDYVSFLEDAHQRGINLNDWLLTKIYGANQSAKVGNYDNEMQVNISAEEILKSLNTDIDGEMASPKRCQEHFQSLEFCFGITKGFIYEKINRDDIIGLIESRVAERWYSELLKNRLDKKIEEFNSIKTANIDDVKNQLTILINEKFYNSRDRKQYRSELLPLLKELE
jgi:hypothetical protein